MVWYADAHKYRSTEMANMSSASTIFVKFGGDGLPDSEIIAANMTDAEDRGDVLTAQALAVINGYFSTYVKVSADGERFRAGSYRLFEFATALRGYRALKEQSLSLDFPTDPTLEDIINSEVRAWEGNFRASTQYAAELDGYGPIGRWTATIPGTAEIPPELAEFVRGYVNVFEGMDTLSSDHTTLLQGHGCALRRVVVSSDEDFEYLAGIAHATCTLCFLG